MQVLYLQGGQEVKKDNDAKHTKGMSPKAKTAFKNADKKMDKKPGLTRAEDNRLDAALAKDMKKKYPKVTGKKEEKKKK